MNYGVDIIYPILRMKKLVQRCSGTCPVTWLVSKRQVWDSRPNPPVFKALILSITFKPVVLKVWSQDHQAQ